MSKSDNVTLDARILKYLKAVGTANTNAVARHLKIKWDRANRGLKRLQAQALVFWHPDIKLWSIWDDHNLQRYFGDSQHVENGNFSVEPTNSTLESSHYRSGIVRGDLGQVVQKEGFVCHPKTKGSDVPRTFVRGHVQGQYLVEIVKSGRMPESFVLPEKEITGGWTVRKMRGNDCYYGHLRIPDDEKPFRYHIMTTKDGSVRKISIYVHPRYIYYKDNKFYAPIEFRQQVRDILSVLEGYGWKFGTVNQRGIYHMAINDKILASQVPVQHDERETDAVHYDSSVKDGNGICTEAEVYDDHESASAEVDVLVELPQRILGIESRVTDLTARLVNVEKGLVVMTGVLERNVDNTEHIISAVTDLSKLTEFNTSVLMGAPVQSDNDRQMQQSKGDAMYG